MKQVETMGAQGDLLVMRINEKDLPKGLKEEVVRSGYVAAHSETGHHHVATFLEKHEAKLMRGDDPFTCYLRVEGDGAEIVHNRPFDTHETLRIGPGLWCFKNQVEYTPAGWRKAAD